MKKIEQLLWHNVPNILTSIRIVLAPFCAYLIMQQGWYLVWGMVVFMIATATDTYDGYFARKYNTITKLGNFLDPLADKLLMGSVFYAFWQQGYVATWFILILFGRDIIVTLLRVGLCRQGSALVTSATGKWKMFLQALIAQYAFIVAIMHGYYHNAVVLQYVDGGFFVGMVCVALVTVYSACEYMVVMVYGYNLLVQMRKNINIEIARFIATLGYIGYVGCAPGTVASVCSIIGLWYMPMYTLAEQLVVLSCMFAVGLLAAQVLATHDGEDDPAHIVIDECVGMWVAILFIPKTLVLYVLAFCLFRFFDITKIFPVHYAEQFVRGGMGIMLDDIIAGICAGMSAYLLLLFVQKYGILFVV